MQRFSMLSIDIKVVIRPPHWFSGTLVWLRCALQKPAMTSLMHAAFYMARTTQHVTILIWQVDRLPCLWKTGDYVGKLQANELYDGVDWLRNVCSVDLLAGCGLGAAPVPLYICLPLHCCTHPGSSPHSWVGNSRQPKKLPARTGSITAVRYSCALLSMLGRTGDLTTAKPC